MIENAPRHVASPLKRVSLLFALAALVALTVCASGAATASATVTCDSCSPWWHLSFDSAPADLPRGGEGQIGVLAENFGDSGGLRVSPALTIVAKVPQGLTVKSVGLRGEVAGDNASEIFGELFCAVSAGVVTCTVPEEEELAALFLPAMPYGVLEVEINVKVGQAAQTGEVLQAKISGAGAPTASANRSIEVSESSTPFGIEHYALRAENADGSPDTQAGSHPFQLTSDIAVNQSGERLPAVPTKDLHFNLPAGLVGNPTPFPECPLSKFTANPGGGVNLCPDDTVVGVASVTIGELGGAFKNVYHVPLFALVPSVGEPARFGFSVVNVPVYLDTSVRTGADYGVTVDVNNITELVGFLSSRVTFWGVPGDPRHDPARGWNCLDPQDEPTPECTGTSQAEAPPLLTMPSACAGPLHTTVEGDSWVQEGAFTPPFEYTTVDEQGQPIGLDGCNQLPFTPSVRVTPDGQAGSTPTGLTVDEHVPQETSLNPTGLAESDVKGLSVTLPEGVVLNPSAADGLQACSPEEIGLQSDTPPSCPESSKIATAKIKTPLLPDPLEGAAYLATQDANPFGSLVAMYLYAEDPISGVRAKATGEVVEDPVTGQLTAHFERDPLFASDPRYAHEPEADFLPELPFEDVELHFFGGDRAPLGTPALCGSYATTGTFTPWSEAAVVKSTSTFEVTSGPDGSPCQSPLPFTPTLTAGTTSIQAGGFTPFVMTMGRGDGEQNLQGITLKMPPGMSGTLSNVKLCDEVDANAGTCGPESQIGETIVSVGLGGDPYTVTGGKVYITGPYKGAPFGLSIVNPAKAGPFDLGKVIVRAKVEVDQETAALTITTDNEGPYKIPTIIDGIPLQIRHVNVNIDRPRFTFNATNCSPLAITGGLLSAQGASSALSVPYQVTNCAVLAFKPKLTASSSGKPSRANGTSLHVKLTYPAGPYDANIARVKVELPKALPSRLTTLQKACTAAVFDQSPSDCPAASVVGYATASTPVLPVPLTGPAIFVSHGGEAFPSLIIVLQGYGVTVHLVGSTFISKNGITSSTFKSVPDVPVGTFELTLPQGPYSALTTNTDPCKAKLTMPTEFLGQNGALIKTTTKITATGCPKAGKKRKKTTRTKHPRHTRRLGRARHAKPRGRRRG
ncbi:MAG TPA: hypothetical protein VMU32_12570 [Solirubrobacteraceae bacterium]|nr:hypothetical protein [Solirubrobacteraceae bacterium]